MARNRDNIRLGGVLVVPMASGGANVSPTIRFNDFQQVPNLHLFPIVEPGELEVPITPEL